MAFCSEFPCLRSRFTSPRLVQRPWGPSTLLLVGEQARQPLSQKNLRPTLRRLSLTVSWWLLTTMILGRRQKEADTSPVTIRKKNQCHPPGVFNNQTSILTVDSENNANPIGAFFRIFMSDKRKITLFFGVKKQDIPSDPILWFCAIVRTKEKSTTLKLELQLRQCLQKISNQRYHNFEDHSEGLDISVLLGREYQEYLMGECRVRPAHIFFTHQTTTFQPESLAWDSDWNDPIMFISEIYPQVLVVGL